MKKTSLSPETLEARWALKMMGELSCALPELPHDICERLRVARESAIQQRCLEWSEQPTHFPVWRPFASSAVVGLGSGNQSQGPMPWLMYMLALLALLVGLLFVQYVHLESQVLAAAEVDADLLADDLPPDAYSDPAFLEFLKDNP